MAPDSSAMVTDSNAPSALLPLDSAIPRLNPDKLNKKIQKYKINAEKIKIHANLQTPLTAFNAREK